ncbi:MAG: hypothetical protein K8I29_07430 [Alphaproteobacteria bacterium]|uniref:Uncharacterized protein n=1 Tax=Candidatus Nitrobium versatile TaxID=2884831 RepID=A0A953M1I7_9BACT|nr:hypothetical protein [Candidatus Nitrobium versatile]
MKKLLLPLAALVIVALSLAWTVPALASPAEQIRDRIANLQQRIDEGKLSGALTPPEAKRLQRDLNSIRGTFEKARKGALTPREIDVLNHRLDILDKKVFKQKHDKQKRHP